MAFLMKFSSVASLSSQSTEASHSNSSCSFSFKPLFLKCFIIALYVRSHSAYARQPIKISHDKVWQVVFPRGPYTSRSVSWEHLFWVTSRQASWFSAFSLIQQVFKKHPLNPRYVSGTVQLLSNAAGKRSCWFLPSWAGLALRRGEGGTPLRCKT